MVNEKMDKNIADARWKRPENIERYHFKDYLGEESRIEEEESLEYINKLLEKI